MNTGFFERNVGERSYVLYIPRGVKTPMPAILALHGAGESGSDNLKQVIQGLGSAVQWNRDRWPFAILFPQKPVVRNLWPTQVEYLNSCLKDAEANYELDPHRRYLTGLSQGGNGTFRLVKKLSWQFAAAAPICGWSENVEETAKDFADIPISIFHGGADNVVPPKGSTDAHEAILKAGGTSKLTTYESVDHNSWDKAYRESDLPEWFLSHSFR